MKEVVKVCAVGICYLGAMLAACGRSEPAPDMPQPQTGEQSAVLSADSSAAEALATNLADSEWRLLYFESMDDSIGRTIPEPSQTYTMRLNADGTVSMALNCNRANGTWTAEPAADAVSGRFSFGLLAATTALCPPPSMDERIVADTAHVTGFLLSDGNLYLSLMADAGIYAWEPASAPAAGDVMFDRTPNPALEDAIREAAPDYNAEIVEIGGGAQARYLHASLDLNDDGIEETFAYLLGPIFCGTGGCDLMLFARDGEGYRLINNFPISRLPVVAAATRTQGWNDLFRPESGGGAGPSLVRHVFDGKRYVEAERLPPEPPPPGTAVLAGDFTFDSGIPLAPAD